MPAVRHLLKTRPRSVITYANAHVLNLAYSNPSLRAFLNRSDLCYCDGNGVRLASQLLGARIPDRITGADWIWDLAANAEHSWSLYWIGGRPGVAARAAAVLKSKHPGLRIAVDHGFYPSSGPAHEASLNRINSFRPDILLVGMGSPRQEEWVASNLAHLDAGVIWCLGATADFVAGDVPRGPSWLTARVEWVARLAVEPRRLWRRYLVGNPVFAARILRQYLTEITTPHHDRSSNSP
jgi:N-acetylglucosaminyldiphosphoundecaprenol N-acetyl-beta-D-mannosaminyltransferase